MLDYLEGLKLCRGSGVENESGCWMNLLHALENGKGWTDQVECVDLPIRMLCITVNDLFSDKARNEVLLGTHGLSPVLPRIFDPLGTVGNYEDEEKRSFILADAAVRIWASKIFQQYYLNDLAAELANLPEIVDYNSAAQATVKINCLSENRGKRAYHSNIIQAIRYLNDLIYHPNKQIYASQSLGLLLTAVKFYGLRSNEKDAWLIEHVLPVIDKMILAGPHMVIEPKASVAEVRKRMGVLA